MADYLGRALMPRYSYHNRLYPHLSSREANVKGRLAYAGFSILHISLFLTAVLSVYITTKQISLCAILFNDAGSASNESWPIPTNISCWQITSSCHY